MLCDRLLVGSALLLGSGCSLLPSFPPVTPSSHCGWRFELLKPPLVLGAPTVTAVTSASDQGMTHLGEMVAPVGLINAGAQRQGVLSLSASGPAAAVCADRRLGLSAEPEPTIADVARALERLESRLNDGAGLVQPLPPPRGVLRQSAGPEKK